MDDAKGSRPTRRQVLGATAGALAAGALPGRTGAQQASGPTVYVGSSDETLHAVDAVTGSQEWAFTQPSSLVRSSPTVVADPGSGDSVGSRLMLGTLGHRDDREYAGQSVDTDPDDDPDGGDDDPDDGDDDDPDDGDTDDGFGPGFGVGGALAGLAGAGYLLKQRLDDENSE